MVVERWFVTGGARTIGSPIVDQLVQIGGERGNRPRRPDSSSYGSVAIVGCG